MGGEQSCGSTRLATDAGFPSLPSEKAFQSVRGELAGFPVGMPSLAREVPPPRPQVNGPLVPMNTTMVRRSLRDLFRKKRAERTHMSLAMRELVNSFEAEHGRRDQRNKSTTTTAARSARAPQDSS
jgi:hypothetical protein